MIPLTNTLKIKRYLIIISAFLIVADISVLLNIPLMRQIFGFLFLTILPGLLILQVLKLNKLEAIEKVVLSVGLSISFLLFFGVLLNNLLQSLGFEKPLTTIVLLIFFNISFITLTILGCTINKNPIFSWQNVNLSTSEKAFLIVPLFFPALSIFGMHVMNATDNNIIVMFLLVSIPIYVVFVCVCNQNFSDRLYPVVIFSISISLLLLLPLRTNHIMGADTHLEYYFFKITSDNLRWNILGQNLLNACLAISLLPTIYLSITNISPEFLFKILYSILFSLSPLVIYILSKKYIGNFYAFLASCFFMFQHNFLLTELHSRTNLAILFFALAIMVLFNDRIDTLKKRGLFIVFMFSCLLSHYSTSYIFFFILLSSVLVTEALSKKYKFKRIISVTLVILFFALIFFWYSQVTEAPFKCGVSFFEKTFSNLNKFFIAESRSASTQALLGREVEQKGIPHIVEFAFSWLTIVLIGIGVITLVRRYKEMSFSELNFKKPFFLKKKFEVEYFVIALTCFGLLAAMVAVPFLSVGYSIDRTYILGLTVLSPFFVIGGITLSKYTKLRAYAVILLVLIPYFLCISGVTYQMFDYKQEITLNSGGKLYESFYVYDQESEGAKWMKGHSIADRIIYCDHEGLRRLHSQGKLYLGREIGPYALFKKGSEIHGYIYLRYINSVKGKLIDGQGCSHGLDEISDILHRSNRIYDNDVVIYEKD